jgi:two-component system cell cycle sensor histidine kinase/response regulator CckA
MEGIGRLAGGIAHDFNNLLTVILGFSRLAADTLPAESPAKGWLGEVTEAAQRAATLTGQLLAFARRQIVAPRIIDIGATVRSATSMLGRLVGEDVRLDIPSPPDDLWPVRVDPGQFEQVLVNLVVNARDAMPDGGTATVRVGNASLDAAGAARAGPDAREGEFVVLEVRDTGSGIPPEIRARIFEPFFTTKGPGKGTGLGLPTCYGIVRQAGGFLALDSAPGAGTSFRVFLPRAPGEVASPPRSLRRTVLLAEDAEPVRTFARCCLEADGHAVREAGDGVAALAQIEAGEPVDILVADLVMPRMGGAELVKRALAARPGLRVLLVSGYTDDPAAREAVASSRLPFLAKPYSAGDLRRAVLETLEAPVRMTP